MAAELGVAKVLTGLLFRPVSARHRRRVGGSEPSVCGSVATGDSFRGDDHMK